MDSALIYLTWTAYVPQFALIKENRSVAGLSSAYVLLVDLVNMELFSKMLLWLASSIGHRSSGLDVPPGPLEADWGSLGDWLNLLQLALQWGLSDHLLRLVLRYANADDRLPINKVQERLVPHPSPPPPQPQVKTRTIRTVWWLFFVFTLLLNILELVSAIIAPFRSIGDYIVLGFLMFWQDLFIFATPFMLLAAYITQSRRIKRSTSATDLSGLSVDTLRLQGIVFALLGLSWVLRIRVDLWHKWYDFIQEKPALVLVWCFQVGWLVIPGMIFAAVSAYLSLLYKRRVFPGSEAVAQQDDGQQDEVGAETAPLIR
ncbi:hypothetical protein FH972_026630 [Carpinus fangiana]|uniref:Uncharacterized protein n=1 Tax=Carpinus fangiana TaxID=176857 RepID=A0A5N6L724_9ROSI|nr:hypothetical protein FH972_026630 [Carpinus fangiana]